MKNKYKNPILKNFLFIFYVGTLINSSRLYATTLNIKEVVVHNESNKSIFTSIYNVGYDCAVKIGKGQEVKHGESLDIERPRFRLGEKVKLFISTNRYDLKPTLNNEEINKIKSVSMHCISSNFFIIHEDDKLQILNPITWTLHSKQKELRENISTSKVQKKIAFLRNNNHLSEQEKFFLNKREKTAKKHLESLLDRKIKRLPRIAICSSGGGMRSFYATSGLISGLNDIGILDSSLYFSALSGSSWMLLSWLASDKNITEFQKHIEEPLKQFWVPSSETTKWFKDMVQAKILYNQQVSFVDWYGTLIAEKLLNNQLNLTSSDLISKDNLEKYPFPILNAVFKGEKYYEWLEMTPYEIGSDYLNSHIPAWALGRKFKNNVSLNSPPEPTLGFLMGILGSSFSGSIKDAIDYLPTTNEGILDNKIYKIIAGLVNNTSSFTQKKLSVATLANFSYRNESSPLMGKKDLELIDGGYACNLPLVPLLKNDRKLDIIVVLDNRQESTPLAHNLRIASWQAERLGLKFPKIDYNETTSKNLSVFREEDCPIIVYIPLRSDPSYSESFDPTVASFCSTFNFNYRKEEVQKLSGLVSHVVNSHKNLLLELIEKLTK